VKKWIAILLLVITGACSVIACCQTDDCSGDSNAATQNQESGDPCSPFFACGTCPNFVETAKPVELPMIANSPKPLHHEKPFSLGLSKYAASFWQPPRLS
jgi:hypothetical protein